MLAGTSSIQNSVKHKSQQDLFLSTSFSNENKNKWDLMKLKKTFAQQRKLQTMKRHHSQWEKIFASKVTDKGFISKLYKQLMQLNIKQIIQSNNGQNS